MFNVKKKVRYTRIGRPCENLSIPPWSGFKFWLCPELAHLAVISKFLGLPEPQVPQSQVETVGSQRDVD